MVAAALTLRRGWPAESGKKSEIVPAWVLEPYKPCRCGDDRDCLPGFKILGERQFR